MNEIKIVCENHNYDYMECFSLDEAFDLLFKKNKYNTLKINDEDIKVLDILLTNRGMAEIRVGDDVLHLCKINRNTTKYIDSLMDYHIIEAVLDFDNRCLSGWNNLTKIGRNFSKDILKIHNKLNDESQ